MSFLYIWGWEALLGGSGGRMTHKEQLLKGARDVVWWCTCGAQGLIPQHDKSK